MTIVEAEPGERIDLFASRMLVIAYTTNDVVLGEFNQHTLEARPGMLREDVIREWDKQARESYFGPENGP